MQFNNPVFKPVESSAAYSHSSFRTEFVPTNRQGHRNDHQYDRIFSSEADISSRINDSLLNDHQYRNFDAMRESGLRRNEPDASRLLSMTQLLDRKQENINIIRFGEDEPDTSLINMYNILQKSNYNVDRINVGMQQLDSLFNKMADVSDISTYKKASLTQAEINRHMTMTIGEDELRDELRDQVGDLPNKENAISPEIPKPTVMRSASQPFIAQESRLTSTYEFSSPDSRQPQLEPPSRLGSISKPLVSATSPSFQRSPTIESLKEKYNYNRQIPNNQERQSLTNNYASPQAEHQLMQQPYVPKNQNLVSHYDPNQYRHDYQPYPPQRQYLEQPQNQVQQFTITQQDLLRQPSNGQNEPTPTKIINPNPQHANYQYQQAIPSYQYPAQQDPYYRALSFRTTKEFENGGSLRTPSDKTLSSNEVKSPSEQSIIQSKIQVGREEQGQFSYISLPRYSKNSPNQTNQQFEVLNVSTPIIEKSYLRHSSYYQPESVNPANTRKNADTYYSQVVNETFQTPKTHEIFVPNAQYSSPKVGLDQRVFRSPVVGSPNLPKDDKFKIFSDSQKELFDLASNNVFQKRCRTRTQKAPKWEKKKSQDPDINVLCINCDELISIKSVDQHSKVCLAKTKKVPQRELVSELISELNRKLGVVRTTIAKLSLSFSANARSAIDFLIDALDRIIENNQSYQAINETMGPLNLTLTTFQMRGDKDSLYLTLLIQRGILLSEEKALKIQFIKQQGPEAADESTLFSELSVVEKMAQQERANLELWKQQHEMMVMVQVQDLANMKYLKREFLHTDNEILSQIRSEYRTSETQLQPGGTSLMSDLHYQQDIDQVYTGPIDKNSQQAPEQDNKRIFYNMAVQVKLNLPHNHKGKNVLIQDIYSKALERNVLQDQWKGFIRSEIDNFRQ